jgi:hypothetical protein
MRRDFYQQFGLSHRHGCFALRVLGNNESWASTALSNFFSTFRGALSMV